jgi:hypothetical protein
LRIYRKTNKSNNDISCFPLSKNNIPIFWEMKLQEFQLNREASIFFLFVRWDFGYCGHYWPIVPAPGDRWWWLWRNWWNEDWQGKPKYSEKTCPSVILSTTNPTWLDPALNPGRRGGKPGTNHLSYSAAGIKFYLHSYLRNVFSYSKTLLQSMLTIHTMNAHLTSEVLLDSLLNFLRVIVWGSNKI